MIYTYSFLIKKSKEFASVAHNVLWYCKVEAEPDRSKGRKVPLPLRENLHEVTVVLRENIMRHMTSESWQFFETITSISGELMPKMSKDEKKAKIA
jgi:signal recognition particle subunit SEC65